MRFLKLLSLVLCFLTINCYAAGNVGQPKISRDTVDNTIRPLMQHYTIPGMAIAVTIQGKKYFFNYGVASRETRQRITNDTLFEIGSISKTLTATLASYAQINGKLSLSNSVSHYFPSLRGSRFDHISLIELGTHTAGGLPLQVPDAITNTEQLMDYFKSWQSTFAAGTYRVYSNMSIGLLGMVAADSMHSSFDAAMEKKLFPALGMKHSYLNVPSAQRKNYAQGYTKKDAPIRMAPGVLGSEAYGVKSNTRDMIRFLEANMKVRQHDDTLQCALIDTHTAYFRSGVLTQDLIWEQYSYPVDLKRLLAGNSDMMASQANPATAFNPPLPPQANVLINKTGSTNGFAAYVAFIPSRKIGIVLLANKNYPIAARVTAAYHILTQLDPQTASKK